MDADGGEVWRVFSPGVRGLACAVKALPVNSSLHQQREVGVHHPDAEGSLEPLAVFGTARFDE